MPQTENSTGSTADSDQATAKRACEKAVGETSARDVVTAVPVGQARVAAVPSPPAMPVASNRRHAYCPVCGQPRSEMRASEVRRVEDALCSGRCDTAWHALEALRLRESLSTRVVNRRRAEYESRQPHPPALSELLLLRWRSGDWTVAPEHVLMQVGEGEEPQGRPCGSA